MNASTTNNASFSLNSRGVNYNFQFPANLTKQSFARDTINASAINNATILLSIRGANGEMEPPTYSATRVAILVPNQIGDNIFSQLFDVWIS